MESTEVATVQEKLPKNSKGNRYYYKNREAILEKKRLVRLAKKGIDSPDATTPQLSLEERRKIKMEFLGVLKAKE